MPCPPRMLSAALWSVLTPTLCIAQQIDFDRDIRPILASRCFHCHGPDENTREADLRLDLRQGTFEDRGGYAAVVAGDPEASELVRRIVSEDEAEVMPPPEAKLSLTDVEKQKLRQWIDEGATWDQHWSFVTPARPSPPEVRLRDWPINAVDYFILSKLESSGLKPSRAASRETLIRRVTLDLTGLPPTPDDVASFIADNSSDAYEKVVDRLLDSPYYGQRMAWEWLDAARYADTDGFQGDPTRSMWPWRDWLVDALNSNKPFDQFTIEMLAGDLLPEATDEQIVATGFNRNHMYNGEGGRIAEETRVENVFDRTETTATVWLGLTMTCARCHDHKFDPITQAEYYSLYAFFNNTSETGRGGTRGQAAPSRRYLNPDQRARVAKLKAQISSLQEQLSAPMPKVDVAQQKWEAEIRDQVESLSTAEPVVLSAWQQVGPISEAESPVSQAEIESFLESSGDTVPSKPLRGEHPWEVRPEYQDGQVHALPSAIGATFLSRTIEVSSARTIELSLGSDDGITVWLNSGPPILDNQVARAAQPDQEVLEVDVAAGSNRLLIRIRNTGGLAGFYFKKTKESVAGLPLSVASIVATPRRERDSQQTRKLAEYYRSHFSSEWQELDRKKRELEERRAKTVDSAPAVMIMDELPGDKRRETKILYRGIYNKPTEQVVHEGTPAILHALPESSSTSRLDMARWIMSEKNPLTSRVTVNRYWQLFFGKGIVPTTEDFGQTGSRPSHPELLDWLAVEFRDSGWNVKQLHKTLVMSATYRQSSALRDALGSEELAVGKDPENKLYWHAPRYRMPSWMLRDQALAVGGLLNDDFGGPAVKTYQPEGIWAEATFGKIRYKPDTGDKLYRRSLYVFWRRIVGPTMFFDSAKRQTCEVKPTRTNTPLHALTTLNETTFVESSRAMAERILSSSCQSDIQRLALAYQLALGRRINHLEQTLLLKRIARLTEYYTEHAEEAEALLEVGESPPVSSLSPSLHAAWTVVCSTLMNLDEFLTRE